MNMNVISVKISKYQCRIAFVFSNIYLHPKNMLVNYVYTNFHDYRTINSTRYLYRPRVHYPEREKYYLQAYLSSNQHKSVDPIDMLPIHLKWPWVHYCGVLRTYLWCQINSKKVASGLHTISGLLWWMNERYTRIQWFLSSSPYTCSLRIKILVGAYQERVKHASKQAAPPYGLIHLVIKHLNYWSNSGVPRGCMQIAYIRSTCVQLSVGNPHNRFRLPTKYKDKLSPK